MNINSLPGINFMRRSLVEMFNIDLNVSYQHVFLYIRQLAIHLRTAVTVKQKENIQAVYNWQYVNSLKLWGSLLGAVGNKQPLQALIYPFVQVCLGTLKLIPSAQYFPLRFHVTQILIELSRDTGVFVPVLPFLVEVSICVIIAMLLFQQTKKINSFRAYYVTREHMPFKYSYRQTTLVRH